MVTTTHPPPQGQHEAAASQFQQLLDRQPCHYNVLVQLLGMLRRAGKLQEANKYIAAAEAAAAPGSCGSTAAAGAGPPGGAHATTPAPSEGGLAYCKGLLHK
jgi:hypothetical protein